MTAPQKCKFSRGNNYLIYLACILVLLFFKTQGAQEERDTVIFEIKTEEIDSMEMIGNDSDSYWIYITLKLQYHHDLAALTGNNIGSVLMITYQNEIYAQPVIRSTIFGGRFMLGPYETKEEAENIFDMIQKEK